MFTQGSTMAQILKSAHPISNTADAVPKEQIQNDVKQILDLVYGGGVAILPLDVAYAVIGSKENAIKRIFAAKKRSYEKPSGLFSNWQFSNEIHILPDEKRAMIREIIDQEKLPFSVVAPFKKDHPFFKDVDPFVIQNSSKANTIDMLLNAGDLHNEIARQSWEAGMPVFGSSANTSLMGSKYRVEDIEPEVLNAVDLIVDYGLSKYHNTLGRSSTIIDFSDFSVIRVGVVFDQLKSAFKSRFNVDLKVNPH
jgi:tRNA A37 threonylcarbamoyladenosine synthetase subunit TsaC/SUA5/YrdC